MLVHRSETNVLHDISGIHDAYKKASESKEAPPPELESKSLTIPDDDAATATIQHSLRGETANVPQDTPLADGEAGVEKKIIVQDLGVLKKVKEMLEKFNSPDDAKKSIVQDLGVLEKVKEMIEKLNSSEWSLAGIRELIDHFSTTTQFNLQGIQGVEQNMKDQNMNLEIGEFSLVRIMEKAAQELMSGGKTDSDNAAGFVALLKKQEANEVKRARQASAEVLGGTTSNTPDGVDGEGDNLLNIEV